MTIQMQCNLCRHLRLGMTCDAFPEGIPGEIAAGTFDHRYPHPDDNGVRFEPVELDSADTLGVATAKE